MNNNRKNWERIQITLTHWTYKAEGWIVTIQCLQGLNIFVITRLIIANLFARMLVMRQQMSCCWFLCLSSGLTCGLLKNHRTPQQLCCFQTYSNTAVQYQSSCIIAMIVLREKPGDHGFLLCTQRTFFFKPRGDHLRWVHSDQMVLEMTRQGRLVW